jgi:hypothetical protein
MYQYSLIETLIKKFKLQSDINKISIIDFFKIIINIDEYYKILENYSNPTEEEQYIIKMNTSKQAKIKHILSQNFYSNIFLDIFLLLNNPYNIDDIKFDIFYDNYKLLKDVHLILIKNYEKIINSDLHKFYNIDLINKWIDTIEQKPIKKDEYYKLSKLENDDKDIKWKKYNEIWQVYNSECIKFKKYLFKLRDFYQSKNISIIGCYNISKELYEHCVEANIGIKLDILNLEKWAIHKLDKLVSKMKSLIIKINPKVNEKLNVLEMLNQINSSKKFKTKEEFIDNYKIKLKKYKDYFIKKLEFPHFTESNLVIFDDENLGGAYYNDNNFYLNSSNVTDSFKYTTETLVLHESIPGHHTQVHSTKYLDMHNNLLYQYFPEITNGFVEGWGLFSEKLGHDQSDWDIIGQIEYDMLRTLRVIVDIRIHYKGYTVDEIYNYMKNYLSISENKLKTEIYRYVCMPGQAISYKVGSQIYKTILKKNNIKYYLDPKAIEIYKEIINNGPMPLKFLVKKYNINPDDIFKS